MEPSTRAFFRNGWGDSWPFLSGLDVARDPIYLELEDEARREKIHIVGPWLGRLLGQLARFANARRILEFGTAIGYATLWLARALPADGEIVTIEQDPGRAERARANLARAGYAARARIVVGMATDAVAQARGPFDLAFTDHGGAEHVLDATAERLRPGGLLIADHVSFADREAFNARIAADPRFETLFLQCFLRGHEPENDAIALALRV